MVCTVCHSQQSDKRPHYLPFSAVWSGSTLIVILSSLIRVYTVCHSQQSGQGLHYLLFSAVWSGSTLFAILSMQHYQGLHCLPFSAFWSESTLLAIRSSLMKVKVYTVSLMNNLIRVYTICHSQQSGQGLHYFPFSAVWSRSRSTLSFSGTVWSGSTLFVILKSLIWVYIVCRSQQCNQGLFCLPFSVIWSGSTLFAILCCQIKVYTVCHSQQSDEGLHYFPF